MRDVWRRIHRWPRYRRWLLKGGFFGAVLALTLFPKFWLIPVWVARLDNLNSVVDPNCPALAELEGQVRKEVTHDAGLAQVIKPVEEAVCRRLPYAFDWETWGVMDYIPTVAEAFAMGREDCDGRAVVAASLLRRMGYDAWVVSDLKHTWVVSRDPAVPVPAEMELMAPGEGERTLTGGPGGTQLRANLGAVHNLVRGLSFGTAVFPLGREIIILIALVAASLQPRSSWVRRTVGCALLGGALVLLRAGGGAQSSGMTVWICGIGGCAMVLGGWLLLVVKGEGGRSPSANRR